LLRMGAPEKEVKPRRKKSFWYHNGDHIRWKGETRKSFWWHRQKDPKSRKKIREVRPQEGKIGKLPGATPRGISPREKKKEKTQPKTEKTHQPDL